MEYRPSLDRFRSLPVTTISKREGLPQSRVASVFPSQNGGVWIGGAGGLSRAEDGRRDPRCVRAGPAIERFRVAQHREKQGYFNAPEYRSGLAAPMTWMTFRL